MPSPVDLLVVGAGPAGLSLAAHAAGRGLSVRVLDPAPHAPWPANYGLWLDEAQALDPAVPLARSWSRPLVRGDAWRLQVDRIYGQVDGPALRALLLERLAAAGGAVEQARVEGADHDPEGSAVRCHGGPPHRGRVLVDCSGHRPALVQRSGPDATAFQTAWGILARVDAHPWAAGEMAFMDFRQAPLGEVEGPASFLYAMPLGPDRVFLEETALAARPALSLEALERRLHRRLQHDGIVVRAVEQIERCVIPMDAPPPVLPQRVLALGGAASMVHPATGYSVWRSLSVAPALAALLAAGLDAGHGPDRLARDGWELIWPAERRRLWEVLAFGRESLLDLDADLTQRFFHAFFSMSDEAWRPFMTGALSARDAGGVMLEMFHHAPTRLRLRLSLAGLSSAGWGAMVAMLGAP